METQCRDITQYISGFLTFSDVARLSQTCKVLSIDMKMKIINTVRNVIATRSLQLSSSVAPSCKNDSTLLAQRELRFETAYSDAAWFIAESKCRMCGAHMCNVCKPVLHTYRPLLERFMLRPMSYNRYSYIDIVVVAIYYYGFTTVRKLAEQEMQAQKALLDEEDKTQMPSADSVIESLPPFLIPDVGLRTAIEMARYSSTDLPDFKNKCDDVITRHFYWTKTTRAFREAHPWKHGISPWAISNRIRYLRDMYGVQDPIKHLQFHVRPAIGEENVYSLDPTIEPCLTSIGRLRLLMDDSITTFCTPV